MKDIKTYIFEAVSDKDYPIEAAKYLLNILDKYIDYKSVTNDDTFNHYIKFESSLSETDLDNIDKQLNKDNVIGSHEFSYDWSKKKYLIINIFKKGQLRISKNSEGKYDIYFMNDLRSYYEKNKK